MFCWVLRYDVWLVIIECLSVLVKKWLLDWSFMGIVDGWRSLVDFLFSFYCLLRLWFERLRIVDVFFIVFFLIVGLCCIWVNWVVNGGFYIL